MPAYVVGLHQITDPSRFEKYKTKIGPMVAKQANVGWVEHLRNPSCFAAEQGLDGFHFALPILRAGIADAATATPSSAASFYESRRQLCRTETTQSQSRSGNTQTLSEPLIHRPRHGP
jgi:hypothetical protein